MQLKTFLIAYTLFAWSFHGYAAESDTHKKPNILLIVADDLGYSDLGVFGSEIQTPNLDKLAQQGRILRNFYAQPTCSPTRSELFSGTDHHLAGVGSMLEILAPEQKGHPGYEGVLDHRVAPLSSLLKDAGYRTYLAGKWHLGSEAEYLPGARGFERSFALLPGGASHFKQAVQRLNAAGKEPRYTENDQDIQLPDDFYSSKTYTDKLIEYIDSGLGSGKPFFAYAAYTAPHWPIQAPDSNLAKVGGRYDIGYDEIAARRFQKQKQLGLVPTNAPQPPLPAGIKPWQQLSAEERTRSAKVYEAYAAAIEALDDNIGRLLAHLSAKGELENTVIVFFSDNGAEGNDLGKQGGAAKAASGQAYYEQFYGWINSTFDNSLNNIGRKNSYVTINEAWGQTSALPNRLYKGNTTEGGMHTPAFVYYPKAIKAGTATSLVTVRDILPTLLDIAGTQHPGIVYQNKPILPLQGTSALPYLTGNTIAVHSKESAFGFELFGRSALRKGDWKIVRAYPPQGEGYWQLFNLAHDPGELHNLNPNNQLETDNKLANRGLQKEFARKLAELKLDWQTYVAQNNVIELGRDYGYGWLDAKTAK